MCKNDFDRKVGEVYVSFYHSSSFLVTAMIWVEWEAVLWHYESVLCLRALSIWITGARVIKIRAEEGNNVREDAMAEQIRLSLVLSASFHFIIELHMMGKQRQTLTMLYISETSSCAFNFTEFGQRQGNVIQLLAKTSSSMCILWTV